MTALQRRGHNLSQNFKFRLLGHLGEFFSTPKANGIKGSITSETLISNQCQAA